MTKKSIKNTISLLLITVIAGLLLGVVYEITKAPIAAGQQKAKEEACKIVFASAASFEQVEIDEAQVENELKKQGYDVTLNEVMQALDEKEEKIGYVLTVTDHEGYGGDIQFTMGVQNDGTLNGISFLSISETAGLGMKAAEDEFKSQFEQKKVEQFNYTKTGAVSNEEIDAISGATITTNAVVNGVNAGLYYIHTLETEVEK